MCSIPQNVSYPLNIIMTYHYIQAKVFVSQEYITHVCTMSVFPPIKVDPRQSDNLVWYVKKKNALFGMFKEDVTVV